jgi:hypothetical protein
VAGVVALGVELTQPLRTCVVGVGAVGARAARQLASSVEVASVVVCDRLPARASEIARAIGGTAVAFDDVIGEIDVVIVGEPVHASGFERIRQALAAGVPVVSVADGMAEVEALLAIDTSSTLVVGAGMAPGLTDILARHGAAEFDIIEEIHVAKAGTAGPACALQHHRALGAEAIDWRDGAWTRRSGGSGRELCWFPDPVGGRDCYRAGLPDALLLKPAFPDARRVTARMAATRRDRLTAALPMLRRPHPEGEVGAVRVELRGRRGGASEVSVLGVLDRPGVAAGAVAAVSAIWAATGRFTRTGAGGLAELVGEPGVFLAELARRGVRAAKFDGSRP